jgi:hypothetical protein
MTTIDRENGLHRWLRRAAILFGLAAMLLAAGLDTADAATRATANAPAALPWLAAAVAIAALWMLGRSGMPVRPRRAVIRRRRAVARTRRR